MSLITLEKYNHFAFDLDGVLVDSEFVVEMAQRRWAVEKGLYPIEVGNRAKARRDIDLIAEYEVEESDTLKPVPGAAARGHPDIIRGIQDFRSLTFVSEAQGSDADLVQGNAA